MQSHSLANAFDPEKTIDLTKAGSFELIFRARGLNRCPDLDPLACVVARTVIMKLWLRLTLVIMTVGGGFAGAALVVGSLLHPQNREFGDLAELLGILALNVYVLVSGLIFVQNPQRTAPVVVALAFQIPYIYSPFIAYQFTAGFSFFVGLVGNTFFWKYSFGSFVQIDLLKKLPWGFGVNIFALVLLILLASLRRIPVESPQSSNLPK